VITESIGSTLRRHREQKRMSLAELSRVTRIPVTSLEAIEGDQFDALPGEVFARGFLRSYARAVGAGPHDVLARYATRRRVVVSTPIPMAPAVQHAGRGGKRFGVAIAFVLLLILFTLALSFVLKPRGHDMPSELSLRSASAPDRAG